MARPVTFEEMVTTSFDQIRNYGAGSPAVLTTLVSTLASLLPYMSRPAERAALIHQARLIAEDAAQIKNVVDRERLAAVLSAKIGASSERPDA